MIDKPLDFTNDQYWGKGGRYVVNADGQRVPALPDIDPDTVGTTVQISDGTGEPMTALLGDTLESPTADSAVSANSDKKGK